MIRFMFFTPQSYALAIDAALRNKVQISYVINGFVVREDQDWFLLECVLDINDIAYYRCEVAFVSMVPIGGIVDRRKKMRVPL